MNKEEITRISNEIKSYIKKSGKSLTSVVEEMNKTRVELPEDKKDKLKGVNYKTTTQNISNKLSRGSLKYTEAKEIAEIIGYSIEWKEKE